MLHSLLFLWIASCLISAISYPSFEDGPVRVHVSEIPSLFFRKGQLTRQSRRNEHVPQIVLAPGPGHKGDLPDSVSCVNKGFDSVERMVYWQCDALVGDKWRLERADVVFERWDPSDNEYVVLGSEQVFITLARAPYYNSAPPDPGYQYSHDISSINLRASRRLKTRRDPNGSFLSTPVRSGDYEMHFVDANQPSPPDSAIPTRMTCHNQNYRNQNSLPIWSCESSIANGWALDQVEIVCEGWDGQNDSRIVKDSCGVHFSMKRDYTYDDDYSFARNNHHRQRHNQPFNTKWQTNFYHMGNYASRPVMNEGFSNIIDEAILALIVSIAGAGIIAIVLIVCTYKLFKRKRWCSGCCTCDCDNLCSSTGESSSSTSYRPSPSYSYGTNNTSNNDKKHHESVTAKTYMR